MTQIPKPDDPQKIPSSEIGINETRLNNPAEINFDTTASSYYGNKIFVYNRENNIIGALAHRNTVGGSNYALEISDWVSGGDSSTISTGSQTYTDVTFTIYTDKIEATNNGNTATIQLQNGTPDTVKIQVDDTANEITINSHSPI